MAWAVNPRALGMHRGSEGWGLAGEYSVISWILDAEHATTRGWTGALSRTRPCVLGVGIKFGGVGLLCWFGIFKGWEGTGRDSLRQ